MCLISIFLPSLAQCWFGAGAQSLRVEGGRREGWKEGQKEGGKDGRKGRKKGGNLGRKVLWLLLPDSPWYVRHVTSPWPTFVLTCERDTPRGLCTHQRDSRCKKSLAEGKSLEKVRGQGGPLERWGLIPSFIYLPPLSRVHIPIVPFHLIGVLAWAVLDVVPLTVRHCI